MINLILCFIGGFLLFVIPYNWGRHRLKKQIRNYINEQRYQKYMGLYGHYHPDYLTKIEELIK